MIFKWLFKRIYNKISLYRDSIIEREIKSMKNIHASVRFYNPNQTVVNGQITIEQDTYMNSGRLISGKNSSIRIGKRCAIGHNVNISSITHNLKRPTGPNLMHKEKDILIGDDVWIGTNVFIREGVTIGNNCVVGANSVVTKSIPPFSIVGGVPAKVIRKIKSE